MTALMQKQTSANCVYVADTANFPYGEKSHEQVVECVIELVQKIKTTFEPKVIVVACNTMSVNALETLREKFPELQFVGTVPAIKLAASVSKKRRIGLIATQATCENPYNKELKNKFASDCELILRGDGELVSYIEHNGFTASDEELKKAVIPAVDFFRSQNCDVIILGCTHFLNIKHIFESACEPQIKVVDSVDGVVRHSLDLFAQITAPLQAAPKTTAESSTSKLFITGFTDTKEKAQYDTLCSKFSIQFQGIL